MEKDSNNSSSHFGLHARLKAATAEIHRQLESGGSAAGLMSQELKAEAYLNYLLKMRAFVVPIENLLRSQAELRTFVPDLDQRMKTELLDHDIQAMGGSFVGSALAKFSELPPITNLGEAMGVLYVMEGSTLGGQLIRRSLLQHEFLGEDQVTYVSAYRERTGEMWRSLLKSIADFDQAKPDSGEAAVMAAVQTFKSLGEWFRIKD